MFCVELMLYFVNYSAVFSVYTRSVSHVLCFYNQRPQDKVYMEKKNTQKKIVIIIVFVFHFQVPQFPTWEPVAERQLPPVRFLLNIS